MSSSDPMDDILMRLAAIVGPLLRPPWYVWAWFWIRSAFSRDQGAKRDRLERWLDEHRTDDRGCGR